MATSAAKDAYLALDAPITGTGIGGRITVEDLMNAAKAAPAAASAPSAAAAPADEVEVVKLPPIRKSIAKAMVGSLSSMAQLTLTSSFDASEIMAYRAKLKANAENLGLANITYNDMVLFAVARTLADAQFKALNANLIDDEMHYFKSVNLGVAVDTDRGLMVPTVMGANHKSLDQIAGEVKELAAQCKDGGIAPDKLKGASFTVSNLGSQGIESFTPVINPPQTGILGVNTIEYRVKMVKGEQVVYPAMGLSLTFDHRALDGLPAAKFLKAVVTNLENFSLLLAK